MDAITLSRGHVVRIENARGMQVCVESGAVWITQERDSRDVLIESGQCFRLHRNGVALLSAYGRAAQTRVSLSS